MLAASLTALAVSVFGLWRLKMTGFAWTTATLATTSYLSLLLLFNWLEQKPEIQALWCLPLALMEFVALALERAGRVRWTMPFHLIAVGALVIGLDVVAFNGPTLKMLGVTAERWSYFDHDRQVAFSVVLNGLLFLALMLVGERSASLDLRRASKWLEVLAILHTISALFANAMQHQGNSAGARATCGFIWRRRCSSRCSRRFVRAGGCSWAGWWVAGWAATCSWTWIWWRASRSSSDWVSWVWWWRWARSFT